MQLERVARERLGELHSMLELGALTGAIYLGADPPTRSWSFARSRRLNAHQRVTVM
jgi:hypothetical protein